MESTYTNPEFSRFLQTLTKYVSKPLGFNKIYQDEQLLKKRGLNFFSIAFSKLI
jgi:hypothetical protein